MARIMPDTNRNHHMSAMQLLCMVEKGTTVRFDFEGNSHVFMHKVHSRDGVMTFMSQMWHEMGYDFVLYELRTVTTAYNTVVIVAECGWVQ